MMRYRGVVEGLERSDREIEKEVFDEDNMLESKMTLSQKVTYLFCDELGYRFKSL